MKISMLWAKNAIVPVFKQIIRGILGVLTSNFLMKYYLFICLLLLAFLSQAELLRVFVSLPVHKTFVKKITGEYSQVSSMLEQEHDLHSYEPNLQKIRSLSKAKLYINSGLPFERLLLKRIKQVNPNLIIVNGIAGIKLVKSEHNEHDELDFHIWTNPLLVKQMAKNILNSLIKIDVKHKQYYTNNYKKFIAELNILDKDIRAIIDSLSKRNFMVFHPAWGYFANNYGLTQIAIQHEYKESSPKDLIKVIKLSKSKNISTIFIQDESSRRFVNQIANAIDAKIVYINPLAVNYIQNMRYVAKKISESLK